MHLKASCTDLHVKANIYVSEGSPCVSEDIITEEEASVYGWDCDEADAGDGPNIKVILIQNGNCGHKEAEDDNPFNHIDMVLLVWLNSTQYHQTHQD